MKAEQLRKSILQLAIQGKLVPQNPDDEPAFVLLERIRAEKQKLIKEGKIKKDKSDSVIFKGDDNRHYEKVGSEVKDITEEIDFELPNGWRYIRLSSISTIGSGFTPKKDELSNVGDIPYFKVADMNNVGNEKYLSITNAYYIGKNSSKIFPKNSIVYPKNGGAVFTNKKRILSQASIVDLNTGVFYPSTELYFDYAFLLFSTIDFKEHYKGTALPTINNDFMDKMLFALPPYNEQVRIVKQYRLIEPLIAEYDKLEKESSALDGEIKDKLKKSILQYAIQGKLVPQNENDEPASELLKRIRAEKKAQLGKKYVESYIYKGDDNCYYEKVGGTVKNISEEISETGIELPTSWTWARGEEIFLPMESTKPQGDKFIYIDIDAINNKRQYIEKPKELDVKVAPSRASRKLHVGDTLFSMVRPYLKNIAYVEEKYADSIASTGFYVCCPYKNLYSKYIFYLMVTPFIIDSLMQHMKGDNSPSIKGSDIENQLYPVPPINEQNLIVEKIKKLFKIIDAKA